MTYYIDESGSTGDLIVSEKNENFSNQEFFSLACIGIKNEHIYKFEEKVSQLVLKYKIQSTELKSKSIIEKKIDFLNELFEYLESIDGHILIELVEKKFIIACNIVNSLILPPYFLEYNNEVQLVMNVISSYVNKKIPISFFTQFSHISQNPSEKGLEDLFTKIKEHLYNLGDETALATIKHLNASYDDYQLMKTNTNLDRQAYTHFLPLPDKNKREKIIGMLPNISSYTNIHARLNTIHNDLSSITIKHDAQDHFDEIIKFYHMNAIKNDVDDKYNINADSDYRFTTLANLGFNDSKKVIGIQVADLFAGLSTKIAKSIVCEETKLNSNDFETALNILSRVQQSNNKKTGLGLNIVSDENVREKIFTRLLIS